MLLCVYDIRSFDPVTIPDKQQIRENCGKKIKYQMAVNQWQLAIAGDWCSVSMPGREVVRGMNPGEGSQSSPDTPQSRYVDIMIVQIL